MPKRDPILRIAAKYKARYGSTLRKQAARIEAMVKAGGRCPRCQRIKLRRVSVGIWTCRKCGYTFAGGAYTPFVKIEK